MDIVVAEPFARLAARGEWEAYAARLAETGLSWWFEMDVPRIAAHLQPLPEGEIARCAPRLRLLAASTLPLPAGQPKGEVMTRIEDLQSELEAAEDADGAAGVCLLALAALWDFGDDLGGTVAWRQRAVVLRRQMPLSALARAALLAFEALLAIFIEGDLAEARTLLDEQRVAAQEAHSAAMTLQGATLQALALTFAGEPERGALVLEDMAGQRALASPTSHTRLYFDVLCGIVGIAGSHPESGYRDLWSAGSDFDDETLRRSMSLLLSGSQLLGSSLSGRNEQAGRLEENVRRQALAEGIHLHASLMHFSLGSAFMRQGRSYRGLLHGQQGETEASRAGSFATAAMCRLLQALSLVDLNEDEEAMHRLETCLAECDAKGFLLLSEAAAVEIAALVARQGETDRAREMLARIRRSLPPGRTLRSALRPSHFTEALLERLRPARAGPGHWRTDEDDPSPVQIEALGGFRMTIRGRPVYDRRWHSGRTQRLLKLLLALGGEKVAVIQLAELMWPDAEGDRAHASLKTALARLRGAGRIRGDPALEWIHWKHGRLSLAEPLVAADSLAFDASAQAALAHDDPAALVESLGLYRGEFLPGEEGGIIAHCRSGLRRTHVSLLEALAQNPNRAGTGTRDQLDLLSQAIEIDPGSERLYVVKMEQELARGFAADALRTFRDADSYLREDQGVPPGAELARLAERARALS